MKKKLFTLLTLLLCVCSGAWADQTNLISDVTLPDMPASSLDMGAQTTYTPDANNWIVFDPYAATGSPTWLTYTNKTNQSQQITDDDLNTLNPTAPFVAKNSNNFKINSNGTYAVAFRFTGAEKASFLVHPRSGTANKEINIALFKYDSEATPAQTKVGATKKTSANSLHELIFQDLTTSDIYVAYVYGGSSGQNGALLEIALKGPSAPAKAYTVTAASNNNAWGTAATSASSLDEGETATITATPKTGYEFTSWSVEGEGASLNDNTANPATLTMGTANATVTATFSAINYAITHNAATGGTYTISVDGGDATSENTTATIGQTITLAGTPTDPAHTYIVWNVKDAGDNDVTVTNNQFTMPASAVTIAPVFSEPLNTLFSMTNITGISNKTDAHYGIVTATISDGASVEVYEKNGNASNLLYNSNLINLNGSGNNYIHITLPNNLVLKEGDVISAEGNNGSGGSISWQLGKTSSASNKTCPYTLTGADALIGATELYIKKNAGAQISSVTIQGAGEVSDLAVTSSATPTVAIGATSNITYSSSSTGDITFTSSDESVATVSNEGVITGVGGGTATIIITQAADDTYRPSSAKVTVTVPETALFKIKILGGTSTSKTGTIDVENDVTADVSVSSNRKMDKGKYAGFTLNGDYSLQTGDIVEVSVTTAGDNNTSTFKFYNNTSNEPTMLYDTGVKATEAKIYRFVMPAAMNGIKTAYLRRGGDESGINEGFNPVLGYIAVYRPDAVITLNASGFATYSAGTDFEYVGADAYTMALDLSGEGSLTGTKITAGTKIPAGAGILFKGTAGAKVSIMNTTGAEDLAGTNNLHGTTDADGNTVAVPAGKTLFVLSGDTFKPYIGTTFAANKAFFQVDGTTVEARSFTMTFDDETTGINAVENTKPEVKDNVYYNLNGQRVANPSKGLFIVNGKKVIIK